MLRIQGLWLQDLGFQISDPVLLKCEDGKLIVTLDKANEEIWKAEEKATQELEQRFHREKKELHARFVAERRETYGNKEVTVME